MENNNQVDQVDPTGGALDAIENEAAMLEGAADQAASQAAAPAAPSQYEAEAWAQIPAMVGGILAMALPEIAPAYNERNCLAWGQGMAAVAAKYGWEAGETMARFAPEIALTMATIPLALPVIQAVKARKAHAESGAKSIEDADREARAEPMANGAPVEVLP